MENNVIIQRLKALRRKLLQEGIDYYLIPTADFHNSEYVNTYFTVREYFCGFTGSNGTLVVWQEGRLCGPTAGILSRRNGNWRVLRWN